MDTHYPDDETVLLNYTMEAEDDELALLNYAMEYPEESDTANGYIYDGYGPAFILADE